MPPERWQKVKELFQSALDREPGERNAFLQQACGGDPQLRQEVQTLLDSHLAAGSFIEQPAASLQTLTAGKRFGPYQVLREIGRGGMGSVYLAVRADDQFNKRVALKVVQAGFESEEVLRRFRHERQILATLEHPNIARLLDGGATEDGLPYLVMDYVEGTPITEYCDRHKLSITERIKLFRQACSAAHYVHQNLIVHRDLKPNNILVTSEGVPKLLDFGIAKLLKPEYLTSPSDFTRVELRAMTPGYASPEQVRGEPITTASDIYSLGVIFYELLTGHRPYRLRTDAPEEVIRVVCELEPERPSTIVTRADELSPEAVSRTREGLPDKLRKRLSGDLDNIVMMAMRKEPRRRYASVEQFSEDLRRHLEGLPVIAHADTFGYRAGKFVRRHKAMAAAAALVALSLVAGIVATSWEARVARAERARAERRFNDVRKLANSFLFEFHTAIQNLPGSTPARRLVVQKALEYLSGLAQESAGDAVLQRELAEAYLKVGDVQGNPYVPNLGDVKGALESYRRALAISEALTRANANDFEARLCLARSHKSVAEVQPILGNTAEAAANFRKAAEIFEALSASRPGDTRVRMELASCYEVLGDVLGHTGLENLSDRAGAIESYRKAMAIDEAVASGEPGNTRARRAMGIVRMKTADMQGDGGDWKAALENYRGALEILQALSTAEPANAQARRSVAMIHRKTGEALAETGDSKRALENLRAALAINERLLAADPTNVQAGMDYALSLRSTGEMLLRTGDKAGALAHFRKVLDILERQSAAEPANSMLAGRHSEMLLYTSKLLVKMGQPGEAHRLGAGGLDVAKQLADRPNAKPDNVNRYAYWLLTCEPADLRNPAAAVRYAERAVESSKGANTDYLSTLAQAYLQRGDAARAVETAERALALLPPSSPARREIEADLARFRNFQPRLSGRGKK